MTKPQTNSPSTEVPGEFVSELRGKWAEEPDKAVITKHRKFMIRSAPGDAIRAHEGLEKPGGK